MEKVYKKKRNLSGLKAKTPRVITMRTWLLHFRIIWMIKKKKKRKSNDKF